MRVSPAAPNPHFKEIDKRLFTGRLQIKCAFCYFMPYSEHKEKIKMDQNYSQINMGERRTIYKLLEAKVSKTQIAKTLGRA